MTNAVSETPLYHQTIEETGVVPDHVYARCRALATFHWGSTPRIKRQPMTTPVVGAKPISKRKRTK